MIIWNFFAGVTVLGFGIHILFRFHEALGFLVGSFLVLVSLRYGIAPYIKKHLFHKKDKKPKFLETYNVLEGTGCFPDIVGWHMAFNVHNVEEGIIFFKKLGFEVADIKKEDRGLYSFMTAAWLVKNNCVIGLWKNRNGEHLNHFGPIVGKPEDIEKAQKALGITSPITEHHDGSRGCMFAGPDTMPMEILHYPFKKIEKCN